MTNLDHSDRSLICHHTDHHTDSQKNIENLLQLGNSPDRELTPAPSCLGLRLHLQVDAPRLAIGYPVHAPGITRFKCVPLSKSKTTPNVSTCNAQTLLAAPKHSMSVIIYTVSSEVTTGPSEPNSDLKYLKFGLSILKDQLLDDLLGLKRRAEGLRSWRSPLETGDGSLVNPNSCVASPLRPIHLTGAPTSPSSSVHSPWRH